MIVDFHTHIGDLRRPDQLDRLPVTADDLLRRLDEEGIEQAVVLPLGSSPESTQGPFLFGGGADLEQQLRVIDRFPDRLIKFGNLDPRMGCRGNLTAEEVRDPPQPDFSWTLRGLKELGCRGIGELTANLPLDDPRVIRLFSQCGELSLPVLFHETGPGNGVYGLTDEVGSPRLERLLKAVPDTIVIGHAPGFWAEIGGGLRAENRFIYPEGPIEEEGSLPRLLRGCPNLYGDLSAMSGFNAISRDRVRGAQFLEEFQDRLLFGTDVCFGDSEGRMPHLSYLRELKASGELSAAAFEKITSLNAVRLLGPA